MNKYWKEFIILFSSSIVLIFILEKSIRDYIPIIFALIGFVRFMILMWYKFYDISEYLVSNQKDLLLKNGIEFKKFKSHSTVDFFTLLAQRRKIIKQEPLLTKNLNQLNILKNLTIISFFGIIILSIISVILT